MNCWVPATDTKLVYQSTVGFLVILLELRTLIELGMREKGGFELFSPTS
jgi:hypothetical protein